MVQCRHLSCILLPLFAAQLHCILLRLVQILIRLHKLINLVSGLSESLILLALRLQLLLLLIYRLELLDLLFKFHYVRMRALVDLLRLN